MKITMKGGEFDAQHTTISAMKKNKSTIYIMSNETGEGLIRDEEITENIHFIYGDFHMGQIISKEKRDVDCLAIDYCYEGRMEFRIQKGNFVYQKPGDLSIDNRQEGIGGFFFPLNHYHALSILFFLPRAQEEMNKIFPGFPVDLRQLQTKFLDQSYPCFINNHNSLSQIFETLRDANMKHQNTYRLAKILELLLILDDLDADALWKPQAKAYFHQTDVDKVKRIHCLLVEDLTRHYTLQTLSEKFNISLTAMTSCFKGVYGKPINTYMREYKMSYAAKELLLSEASVAQIGLKVGYANPSKFSSAFRQVLGMGPKSYRKRKGNFKNQKGKEKQNESQLS